MSDIIEENIEQPDKAQVWLSRNNPRQRVPGSVPNFQDMMNNQFYKSENNINDFTRQKRYSEDSVALIKEVKARHLEQTKQQIQDNLQTFKQDTNDIISSLKKDLYPKQNLAGVAKLQHR